MEGSGRDAARLGYPERDAKPAIVVSACLLGVRCNHRGEANTSEKALRLSDEFRVVPVCPESMGGLPTPRPAAERRPDGRVVAEDGSDVTAEYTYGAAVTAELARINGARRAVLKARSPSCGCHQIKVDGELVDGEGVAAEALRKAGLELQSEEDL
jgi:uncharacterized protein YbbK (DUF523 family)